MYDAAECHWLYSETLATRGPWSHFLLYSSLCLFLLWIYLHRLPPGHNYQQIYNYYLSRFIYTSIFKAKCKSTTGNWPDVRAFSGFDIICAMLVGSTLVHASINIAPWRKAISCLESGTVPLVSNFYIKGIHAFRRRIYILLSTHHFQ